MSLSEAAAMIVSRVSRTIFFLIALMSPGLSIAADNAPQPAPSQTSTDTSPKGGPASSTTKTPPTASETSSPSDAAADYQPSCQPLTDALKIDSKLGTARLDADAQFAALRDARQNVVRAIQQAGSRRELLKTRLDERRRQYSYTLETPVMTTATKAVRSVDEIRKELIDLVSQAAIIQRQMDDSKQPDMAETFRGKLDEIQRKVSQLKIDMDIADEKVKTDSERAIRERGAFLELKNSVTRSEAAVQTATADIECLTALENKIDANIYSTLIPETQKNQFKLWMSGLFALMVFSVILGFFTVALKDATIRAAIFSNQTGIQFVTLFSLVIAIILFGITGILEAKELSALLGGISGYILGRVTTDRSNDPAAAVSQRSGPAKAVTAMAIEFAAPNMIRNPAGGFEVFSVNSRIRVNGSTANSGDYSVASVSATELVVAEQSIKAEQPGPAITIAAI